MTWTNYVSWLHSFNSLRMHLSRDLLLLDILIFVEIKEEIIICVKLHLRMQVPKALVAVNETSAGAQSSK